MDYLNPVDILLVEDNPADARLIINHFKNSSFNIIIRHVVDGAEALDYLYQREEYKKVFLPDILILDMNLPKVDGMTVLKTIKEDKDLNNIPVIIFGTSNDSKEIRNAYNAQANCYIVKPLEYEEFNNVLNNFMKYWVDTVMLPKKL